MEEEHKEIELDTRDAGKAIWLVKIPKYLAEAWKNCEPGTQMGELSMDKDNKMSEVVLNVADRFVNDPTNPVPQSYNFNIKKIVGMNRCLLATTYKPNTAIMTKAEIRGKMMHRCEIKPTINKEYFDLHKARNRLVKNPRKQMVTLDKAPRNHKPIMNHDNNIEYDKKKKEDGKRIRLDKDMVLDVLFKAFQKHQFYSIKDLVSITTQPVIYLKEILTEICTYRTSAPNKNTWELKKEYRCYKEVGGDGEEEEVENKKGGGGDDDDDNEDDDDDENDDDFKE